MPTIVFLITSQSSPCRFTIYLSQTLYVISNTIVLVTDGRWLNISEYRRWYYTPPLGTFISGIFLVYTTTSYHIYSIWFSEYFSLELQAAEDPQNSVMAKVELKKLFGKRTVSNFL
jgi:hypothetical protein